MQKLQNSPVPSSLAELAEGKEMPAGFQRELERRAKMTPEELAEYSRALEQERMLAEREYVKSLREQSVSVRIQRSGIPEDHKDASIDEFDGKVSQYAHIVANGGRESLIIRGDVGTGKTTAGCAILNHLVKTRSVRFITFYRFVMLMNDVYIHKTRSREEVFNEYANVDVLMIDDLGKELAGQNTDKTITMLWSILDWRKGERKPTIITTQYASDDLFKQLVLSGGDTSSARAIVDRLRTYVNIPFEGPSRRVQATLDL